jgi:benzoyl-CoA reductase/2-hydroxyglutaryl-CoA dehydratase subunit BcrC/BadD/HgdB
VKNDITVQRDTEHVNVPDRYYASLRRGRLSRTLYYSYTEQRTIEEKRVAREDLDIHLRNRPAQLQEAKEKGVKIIGFFPGNYVPEEIIYASGAIPICLVHGGGSDTVDASLEEVPTIMCPFSRAQVGERLLQKTPYYRMIDMLVAPITCQHLKKAAEIWEYHGDIEIFKLGIPHQYDTDFGLQYYVDRVKALKDRVEAITGNEVTGEKLSEAVGLYNRIRDLLRKISLLRRNPHLPIRTLEFLKLNHASFYADPHFMVTTLEAVYEEARNAQQGMDVNMPRLLLLGPNVAYGDYKILELVESAGGEIVVEELCEGTRYYWQNIKTEGDLLQSLATGYLRDRLPCAFMTHSAKRRLDFTLNLVKDFSVSGLIWYDLLNCETYDSESYFFTQRMREHKIPMLILESDYGTLDRGQLRNRIEAFIEQISGVVNHD